MNDNTVRKLDTDIARQPRRPVSWPVCVIVFFIGNVLMWADRANFSVGAAVWAKEFGWAPSRIGFMLSAFSIGYLVMQPLAGWLADTIGFRRGVAFSLAASSIWVLATPLAPTILWLTTAFRVLLGVTEAPFIPSSVTAAARVIPSDSRRARYLAFMMSGAQLGPAVGVFISGLILSHFETPVMIFVFFGSVGLLFAAVWWICVRHLADPQPSAIDAQSAQAKERARQPVLPYSHLLFSRGLWPLYIGNFAMPYCNYLFINWLPQYLSHYRHLSIANASFLSAFPFLIAFVAANVSGFILDGLAARGWRMGGFHRKFMIALGAMAYIVCTLAAVNADSTMTAVYLVAIATAGLTFYNIPFWLICADMTPHQGGTIAGIMSVFGIVGGTISPYLSGVIAEATGAFVAPLELAVTVMAVCSLTTIFFLKVRPISEVVR
jgi:MFS family permease